ncbi:MAG: hypothetical protein DRQ88_11215 [Epsilonproteobacteria bacterium]|nr:MAG: hypothetical protein DRQ88_11215 [Campylobacterota bacterium]RLA64912.1 MAG: hypothetical protein DRQ89_02505 [Campylobacterota bacterium]
MEKVCPQLIYSESIEEDVKYSQTVISLLKEQVRTNPTSPALKFKKSILSFHDLDQKSDQLATKLLKLGVGPEDRVALLLPQSFELIISIYGILKAGAAFVPLGINDGKERFQTIMEDLDCKFILGNDKTLAARALQTSANLISVDIKPLDEIKSELPNILPNTLAYVIYTSGTTGIPKGAMIEQRNLYSFITVYGEKVGLGFEDRVLQNPSTVFDASLITLFSSISFGATLVLWEGDIYEVMAEEKITNVMLTPSYVSLMEPKNYPHLKTLSVGGEKCPDEFISRFSSHVKLFNGYGPTECTCAVSWTLLNDLEKTHIGDNFKNCDFYVVNSKNKQVKGQESGELWVGGDLVGRGYLNRPELNAEKFIANPFGVGTLYRTGDLVRWKSHGVLEYLGRIDRQVKIRGFRVELDEIEKQIERFPGVTGSIAKVVGNNLIAYVTPKSINIKKLTQKLLDGLPKYAVPHKILTLKKFPLTAAGKVDSSALPDPFSQFEKTGAKPTSVGEIKMAENWSSILFANKTGQQVYLNDNFFDLGGNSLHVLKLIQKLRKQFKNPKIPHELVFEYPIFKDFLQRLENWVPDEVNYAVEGREAKLSSLFKSIPTTLYFSIGFIFPFVSFSLLSIKFPALLGYALFEYLFFGLIIGPTAIPFLRRIIYNPIFQKMSFKKIEVIEDHPLGDLKGSIISFHPHGINDIHFYPLATHLYRKGIKFKSTFDKNTFALPFNRTLYSILGYLPPIEKSYKRCKERGENLCVTPGELPEMLLAYKPATIILKSNLNFFQVAIKTGMPLVPGITYNMHKLYKFYPELTAIRSKLPISPSTIPILPFRGRWGLPIPFRQDYKMVLGKKIEVTQKSNPTFDDMVQLRDRYQEELKRIFNKYKPSGYPPLEII